MNPTWNRAALRSVGGPHQATNQAVATMIDLVEELIAVIEAENRHLAMGAPASVSYSAERKTALAEELSRWTNAVRSETVVIAHADPGLRKRLLEHNAVLRRHMHENLDRLRAAIGATRRRVEAIMQAIREQVSQPPTGYGANGRMAGMRNAASTQGSGRYF